jgi:hypothetical protein
MGPIPSSMGSDILQFIFLFWVIAKFSKANGMESYTSKGDNVIVDEPFAAATFCV